MNLLITALAHVRPRDKPLHGGEQHRLHRGMRLRELAQEVRDTGGDLPLKQSLITHSSSAQEVRDAGGDLLVWVAQLVDERREQRVLQLRPRRQHLVQPAHLMRRSVANDSTAPASQTVPRAASSPSAASDAASWTPRPHSPPPPPRRTAPAHSKRCEETLLTALPPPRRRAPAHSKRCEETLFTALPPPRRRAP